jgi:hypothetical protein
MFNGIEQVNAVLNCGGRVVAIEPGGAIMRKLSEDAADLGRSGRLSAAEMRRDRGEPLNENHRTRGAVVVQPGSPPVSI